MTTHRLAVNSEYPIYVGHAILGSDLLPQHIHGKQVMIVSHQTIADHYLAPIINALADYTCDVVTLPMGEQYKTLSTCETIFTTLIEKHHERSTTLIALGGGMVGDITGFAAACYQRGVRYLHIPTSLIAQVDSSIGGKTGVNYLSTKNMLGAFHQPHCVLIDTQTLHTLPEREFISGLAEVIKYALIQDVDFFLWLEQHIDAILARDHTTLLSMIKTCIQHKTNIVALDPHDLHIRQQLNFGHTFGHALESISGFTELLHGEAVAMGMVLANRYAHQQGLLSSTEVTRIEALLLRCGLLIDFNTLPDKAVLLHAMQKDKKVQNRQVKVVLLQKIGQTMITNYI